MKIEMKDTYGFGMLQIFADGEEITIADLVKLANQMSDELEKYGVTTQANKPAKKESIS